MNNNDLTSLPVDAFKYNTEFREIWLHDNALTSLPADAFKYNTELRGHFPQKKERRRETGRDRESEIFIYSMFNGGNHSSRDRQGQAPACGGGRVSKGLHVYTLFGFALCCTVRLSRLRMKRFYCKGLESAVQGSCRPP